MEDRREAETSDSGLGGPLGEIGQLDRKRYARRLMLRAMPLVPFVLASVLTTKAVAASKLPSLTLPTSPL